MNKKGHKVFGLILVAALMAGTMLGVLPVSAGNGYWSAQVLPPGITVLEDVYVTADNTTTYLVGNNGSATTVWRFYQGSWTSIFTRNDTNGYIIRGAPDNNDTVYVADNGATLLIVTRNGGGRWFYRSAVSPIQDLAVESAYVVYELTTDGVVNKSTNGAFTWSRGIDLGEPGTLTSLGANIVLFGSADGHVAFSSDGNVTWTSIVPPIYQGTSVTQVTATGCAAGDYIFAAGTIAGGSVYRWQIGTSTSWTDMGASSSLTGLGFYGIKLSGDALYVLGSNGTDSTVLLCADPDAATPSWAEFIDTGEVLNDTPQGLQVSTSTTLTAISTNDNTLQSYTIP
jgi:hypothetical protein